MCRKTVARFFSNRLLWFISFVPVAIILWGHESKHQLFGRCFKILFYLCSKEANGKSISKCLKRGIKRRNNRKEVERNQMNSNVWISVVQSQQRKQWKENKDPFLWTESGSLGPFTSFTFNRLHVLHDCWRWKYPSTSNMKSKRIGLIAHRLRFITPRRQKCIITRDYYSEIMNENMKNETVKGTRVFVSLRERVNVVSGRFVKTNSFPLILWHFTFLFLFLFSKHYRHYYHFVSFHSSRPESDVLSRHPQSK